jgi:hypothetical protein
MFRKVLFILVMAALLVGSVGIASAEVTAVTEVEETTVEDLGEGFYRLTCKYKFKVNGVRRATVRTRAKFQFAIQDGDLKVRNRWATVLSEWDFYPNDGYDLVRDIDNFDDAKPWDYEDTRMVYYYYVNGAWLWMQGHTLVGGQPNLVCGVFD